MENQITVKENTSIAEVQDFKQIAIDYLRGQGMKLPTKYESQFINACQAYGLNPIKREIYAVGYGENWNVITGYEVYLKRAERTGKLNGWECHVEGKGNDMIAKLTINRKDWAMPFHHEVPFTEAVQKKRDGTINSMWAKMPSFMLKKVCIAQGFRLCFPDELGGMLYTSDELPEIEIPANASVIQNETIKEVPKQNVIAPNNEPSDDALVLDSLLRQYAEHINPNVMKMCDDALEKGDVEKITEMNSRLKSYLSKKGVKIA